MKIYLTHYKHCDYENELYQPIKLSSLVKDFHIIFPYDTSKNPTNSKEVISNSDIILAEVSYHSTGQGIELGWAENMNKPIITFYKNQPASRSTQLISTSGFSYNTKSELISGIIDAIKKLS